MGHGPSSESESAEPNLVPLLDLVLQLVMFFMMCANFAMDQVTEDIVLPVAQSAKPLEKGGDSLFLNVTQEGKVKVLGREHALANQAEIEFFLRQQADDAKKTASNPDDLKTLIIIRAHRDADYKDVFNVLRLCKQAGFRKLQLRAKTQT
jgi:biopolymer transport protein ExbD